MTKPKYSPQDLINLRSSCLNEAIRTNGIAEYAVLKVAQEYYDFTLHGKLPKTKPAKRGPS